MSQEAPKYFLYHAVIGKVVSMGIFKKNIFDIAGSLKTLKTGNSSEATSIDTAVNYLLSTQKTDGGWGSSEGEESNVYTTAVVSIMLKQFSQTPQLAASINKAADYLIAKQNADGGFGSSSSVVHDTALIYIALIDNIKDVTILDNARNYLISMQLTNDSWNDDPNSTVSALRALCSENSKQIEGPKPDRYWRDCGMDRYLNKQTEAPEPEKGGITGQVIDGSTKVPLKDVSVCLESDPEIQATTDISGKFNLSDISPGNQNIMLTLMEYTSDAVSVEVNSGTAINLGALTLLPNLAVDDTKMTVEDVTEDHDETVVSDEPKENGITAKAGARKKDLRKKVSIAMLRRGAYDTIEPEIVPANEPPLLAPQINKPSSTATGIITGSVFDNVTKKAVQNASVNVVGKLPVNTNEEGIFTVQDVAVPDICQVTISKEGYADQFYQGDLATNETMDMLVYLVPTCVDSDETGEAEMILNTPMTSPAATLQPTTTNAVLGADQLNALLAGTTDAVRLGPEIMIKLDETLTPFAVVPDGDKQIQVDIRLEGVRAVTDPVVLFAATNTAGDKITVAFDKVMVDPSDKYMKFGVNIDNAPVSVIAAALNRSDTTKIDLSLALPITGGQNILLNYTAGDVKSSDGQELASFSDKIVSNKVLPPLYCQDGFGYSGLVAQNPLQDDIFMTGYNQWPSGFYKNVLAFISG
jgi:hypothetical protein